MYKNLKTIVLLCMMALLIAPVHATIEGSLDPASVVAEWSNSSTYPKVIDINFSDETWPDTWQGTTGVDCPSYEDGGYVNAILSVPANGGTTVTYPVLFHNCTFATKKSSGGFGGATAAFCRQYYLGQNKTGNSATTYNDWTVASHTTYLEDNIKYDSNNRPTYGEAGFVQMCRDAATDAEKAKKISRHGWVEIDHIPYVERVQWSWSSTSWGRGIKCDYKIGDGDWQPLVWMGSDKHKSGYTVFSDQGYFMENVINASDVSLRWRVWDGDNSRTKVQVDENGASVFKKIIDTYAQQQAPRVHKIQIFGNEITAEQAAYAKENPVSDVGELSDLDQGGDDKELAAPDADAPIVTATVSQDGTADYTTIQAAIDAVPDGSRGIIYIRPGVYDENIYAGTKESKNKFISLIGESQATTILTSSVDRGANNSSNTYNDCAALNVYTPCFYAENLTIRNTSGNVGQAEALFTNGDAHIFKNCLLSGYQDTYKANVGSRGYFTGCTIEGATDFVYDGGLEWFDNCEIRCVAGGYITAPAESGMPMTRVRYPSLSQDYFYPGLFFRGCKLTASDGVADGTVYLGRPWKEKSGAMFIKCALGSHISAKGWKEWDGTENTSSLYEYKNTNSDGTLADVSGRASFSHQATDAEVEAYMCPDTLFSLYKDTPFDYQTILRGAASPMNFVISSTEISWESDDNAAGFLIYKDGEFVKFTTDKSIAKDADDDASYSVASVSRQGVVSNKVTATDAIRLPAFPTAEGFGKYATGGRGGKVVKVTSLKDDNSAGTLRWAFSQYPDDPITIVFEVSGDIQLNNALSVKRADWTLAGQTAPGDGIVITHNKVNFGGSENFIIRNVRFRSGHADKGGEVLEDQALGSENCSNYIFDHCVFGWSVEENMNTQDSHFLTVQNSIVHEGLYNSGHKKGARGYGTQWGGSPATYCRNLLAHNKSRSPRINGARGEDYVVFLEYINNVNYNFGGNGGCYGGENTAAITAYNGLNSAHECNFMNNYYKPGPASSDNSQTILVNASYARDGATSWAPSQWYINGNKIEGNAASTADNWKAVTAETYSLSDIRVDSRIVPAHPYYKYTAMGNVGTYDPQTYMIDNILSADMAYADVLASAGTINRDAIEARIVKEVEDGNAKYGGATIGANTGIIDTEADCEGFIAYATDYTVPTDTDGDGMPDAWETAHGLNPNVADQNLVNSLGYTALEVYLNSLMREELPDGYTTGVKKVIKSSAMRYDRNSATLYVENEALGATLTVYSTDGQLLHTQRIATAATSLSHIKAGIMLIRIDGKSITPRVMKVAR